MGNQSALNIVMQSTDKSLDEVVVIGLASWSWGSTRYTVYTASAISDEECTQVVTNLMELSYHE